MSKHNKKESHQSAMVFYPSGQEGHIGVSSEGCTCVHASPPEALHCATGNATVSSRVPGAAPMRPGRSEAGRLRGATVHREPIAAPSSARLLGWRGQREQKTDATLRIAVVEDATAY